jgi:chromosome segregation ATPase
MPAPEPARAALSPERRRLATAIAQVNEWERYISRCRDVALANAEAESTALGHKLTVAETALKDAEARGNSTRSALKRALGEEEAGPSPEAARRDVDAARAAHDEAWNQKQRVKEEIQRLEENELHRAEYAVKEAIAGVLNAEGCVDGLLRQREALLTQVNAIDTALEGLVFAMPGQKAQTWSYKKSRYEYPPDNSVSEPYRLAVAALSIDASAPCPGDGSQPEAVAA